MEMELEPPTLHFYPQTRILKGEMEMELEPPTLHFYPQTHILKGKMELEQPTLHNDPLKFSEKRLLGKVAIITGGARGIGAATAKLFAHHGAHVIIADVLDDLGVSLAGSIGGRYIHCNVAEEDDMESAVQLALAWKGQVDIMFNNAGIGGPHGSITNLNMAKVKALLEVNVNGNIHGIKHAARAMIRGGKGGCIICTSSSAAIMGGLASHGYTLSKEAIVGLMRSAACELGVHGIRVNCISPHGVPTEMLVSGYRKILGRRDVTAEEVSRIVEKGGSLLRGRVGGVEDIAQAALFLASEDAGFITAHNLVVDGGYTSACTDMSFIYQEQGQSSSIQSEKENRENKAPTKNNNPQ